MGLLRCSLLLVVILAVASYAAKVVELDAKNFETTVAKDEHMWAVEFSSNMCGSCKEFEPSWERLTASKAQEKVRFGHVLIDNNEGMALAEQLGVLDLGIPTVRLFHKSSGHYVDLTNNVMEYEEVERLLASHTQGCKTDSHGFCLKKKRSTDL